MTYTTMGLARAILALRREALAEGRHPTLNNLFDWLRARLPPDVDPLDFHSAIILAANILAARDAHKRTLRRNP